MPGERSLRPSPLKSHEFYGFRSSVFGLENDRRTGRRPNPSRAANAGMEHQALRDIASSSAKVKVRSNKSLRQLLRAYPHWRASSTGRGHIKLVSPAGTVIFTGGTPSDGRSLRNLQAHLRRVERGEAD